jgi:hypothetical protein
MPGRKDDAINESEIEFSLLFEAKSFKKTEK